ncbi:NADP-dependent oxidoreductase [Nakamurella antarctica]|uniref:NADP-dependent oxidoreductase n=1 Tax=Nakamurella antarctica TaxID=1902245 RepID=A0A3G8ZQP6_9ACTN|nr:NADP-dependent oxidoreductase [Nakamurella antarctica]AZI59127.1 NADP-dependent oxidoreductase [Nakamurella antarctica]
MKAAILREYGKDLEVADVERPDLPGDSVMVEVHAAAINPIDWIVMAGYMKEQLPYTLPWIVGYDVSGVVTEVGSGAHGFAVGDEVFARANGMQAGTMAEFSAVKATDLALKPANISHAEAAGVPLAGLTAWQALFDKGGLKAGQRVLIHAGSGGVGTLAIQIAKNAGAWVATTASAKNKDLVLGLGADQFIDYASERFEDAAEKYDLVFDMLGDDTLKRSFDAVKAGGTVVSIKGEAPSGLAADRGVSFHTFFMEPNGKQLTEIAQLISDGTIRPVVDSSFPIDDVVAAFVYARTGGPNGKVVVTLR